MKNYRVTARRTGDWWALDVPEIPGVHSQTKRLEQADKEIREAIALMLDIEEDEFDVTIEPDLPRALQELVKAADAARATAEAAQSFLRATMALAATRLSADLSQRDAGYLLDVSFQRVHQLKVPAEELPRLEAERHALTAVLAHEVALEDGDTDLIRLDHFSGAPLTRAEASESCLR